VLQLGKDELTRPGTGQVLRNVMVLDHVKELGVLAREGVPSLAVIRTGPHRLEVGGSRGLIDELRETVGVLPRLPRDLLQERRIARVAPLDADQRPGAGRATQR